MTKRSSAFAIFAALALAPAFASAAPPAVTVAITLKDHQFSPAKFDVPAGVKVGIDLTNQDASAEEFDSHDLRVEKVVAANGHKAFTIGPLKPGVYHFMGEFHPATAQGVVTVAEGH